MSLLLGTTVGSGPGFILQSFKGSGDVGCSRMQPPSWPPAASPWWAKMAPHICDLAQAHASYFTRFFEIHKGLFLLPDIGS
jgi:hypothetical protein